MEGYREVTWDNVKNGDEVYIAGNIVEGEVTRVYGPHFVSNKDVKLLVNSKGRPFYERFPVLFKKNQ